MSLTYAYLFCAILAEVLGTAALKASDGFSRPWPSLLVVLGYGVAFFLLSLTLRQMQVGIAYAIWSGVGTVLISIAAVFLFGQRLDLPAMMGIGLIVSGVLVINLFSDVSAH
ncbi:MAG: EamA family transporter [Rhodocyclaceae bacterium]|nr:EamA family transporter [Rhodocyclaceae bacterium]MCB1912234.1 EamA family transporter [Rhodocyclaceae bacterium]MCP5239703.1 EamA family transporter [Zoogloeaceae bacterium]MCP5256291.1 EamA family transporter [Zoogloeaceae bacterium]MCW5615696.1 EamA family transporter [Rhodocyclaceae bacterium]